jgi:pilus assembly protein Flp/PilA
MRALTARFAVDESGASSIEYALVAAIVSLSIIVALGAFRDGLNNIFNNVNTQLSR